MKIYTCEGDIQAVLMVSANDHCEPQNSKWVKLGEYHDMRANLLEACQKIVKNQGAPAYAMVEWAKEAIKKTEES